MSDYWDTIIAGATDIFGSHLQSNAARDAANTASDGYLQGIQALQQSTGQARLEILDRMNPALADFNNQIASLQNEISTGTADIINIMSKTTGGIDTLLAGTGANVQRALLGSAATSRGIPRAQFDQQFNGVLTMPPEAQRQAMDQFQSAVHSYTPATPVAPANATNPETPAATGNIAPPTTGGIAGGLQTGVGDGAGTSDSDVTASGSLPPGALSALGQLGGGIVGTALGGPFGSALGRLAGQGMGGLADGQGGGPGALADGTAGSDAASLAAAEAAAGIPGYDDVGRNFTPADSTGGPSQGDPSEAARLRANFLQGKALQDFARQQGWRPSIDANGNPITAEMFLQQQGINPETALNQGPTGQAPMTDANFQDWNAPAPTSGIGGAAGLNTPPPTGGIAGAAGLPGGQPFDVMPTVSRLSSAATGDAIPIVQDPSGQYVPPSELSTGFVGAASEIESGRRSALSQLATGAGAARIDIERGTQGALAEFQPYADAGRSALQQEAAMTGALGPEAQQAAFDSFIESPGQKYLREQAEQALLRSSAATGGLGGGRVKSALMEQAMGIAATRQNEHLANLRSLATRGQAAADSRAGTIAGGADRLASIMQSFGISTANLATMTAQQKAQLAERAGLSLAQLEQAIGQGQISNLENFGQGVAQLRANEMNSQVGLGQTGALTNLQGQQQISSTLANLATLQGTNTAGLLGASGQAQAAGQMAQGNIWGNTSSRLGNMVLAAQ